MAKTPDDDTAAGAMARVLEAERDAAAAVAQARRDAAARVDAARDAARTLVNDAAERIARRQERHARALSLRVQDLQARAAAHPTAPAAPDSATLDAAVRQVAARLTTPEPAR